MACTLHRQGSTRGCGRGPGCLHQGDEGATFLGRRVRDPGVVVPGDHQPLLQHRPRQKAAQRDPRSDAGGAGAPG